MSPAICRGILSGVKKDNAQLRFARANDGAFRGEIVIPGSVVCAGSAF
jgi:hypothetical protein